MMRPFPADGETHYDAIVIGTGIGGSTAGVCLAKAGKRVLILEKNARAGGSCSYYERKGFRVDVGTHLFCRGEKGPLGEVLRRVGQPSAIRFKRAAPLKVRGNGVYLHIPRSRLATPLALLFALHQTDIPLREFPGIVRFFNDLLRMSEREMEKFDRVSMHDFILQYTRNPYVYIIFNFLLGLYFIIPPRDVSAGEAIWCFQRMARDNALSYPIGGASAIPLTYLKIAEEYGATVLLKCGAEQILVEEGRAVGVRVKDGRVFRAGTVISTTSLKDTVHRLTGRDHFSTDFVQRVDRLMGSQIAVQAKIGLRRPLVRASVLIGGTPMRFTPGEPTIHTMDRNFETFFQGKVPPMTPIYCPIPTYFDPTLGPPGTQLLTACALAPTSDIPLQDAAEKWTEAMMDALRQMIPGLDRETIFADTFSVGFIEKWIGKSGGAAITTAQAVGQTGADRPAIRSEIPGLYFAGDCAGGRGVGTELAATSGMLCADAVITDLDAIAPCHPIFLTSNSHVW